MEAAIINTGNTGKTRHIHRRDDGFTLGQKFRRGVALILITAIGSAQAFGQQFPGSAGTFSENAVKTIRLAQADSSWPGEIDIDIDPPVIDHEALVTGISSEPQNFSAIVVDDRGLQHVMLFYRDRSGAQYESVPMQSADTSSEYTASIDTALGQTRIEYYIEALDTGGNRVLKGFPFFPLVRELTPQTANAPVEKASSAPDSRIIYVLLGVAAVGLALALSSSDDGSNTDPDTPTPGTVPLTIEVTPP